MTGGMPHSQVGYLYIGIEPTHTRYAPCLSLALYLPSQANTETVSYLVGGKNDGQLGGQKFLFIIHVYMYIIP